MFQPLHGFFKIIYVFASATHSLYLFTYHIITSILSLQPCEFLSMMSTQPDLLFRFFQSTDMFQQTQNLTLGRVDMLNTFQ